MNAGAPQPPGINPGMQPGPGMAPSPQMGMPPQMGTQPPPKKPDMAPEINKLLEQINIADDLDEEKLEKIGQDVVDGFIMDQQSKESWDHQVDEWVKLAAQIKEEKTWPWNKASNVRYPLLATAAMQFAARAYPSLVPADGKIVQFRVVGADAQGQKAARADKLAAHMNYQLLEDMSDWEEEMDRLLIQLPIVGCIFKKTYFDPIKKRNVSRLVGPKDLVVNYWATSLEAAHRKTEICLLTKNQVKSYQTAGVYRDVDIGEPVINPESSKADVHGNQIPGKVDATTPYTILEQHTFLDLDDDGYDEPYIITVEKLSRKVLRVVARFDSDGVLSDKKGKVICIEPVEYYTKYGFVPNPDGGFYDIGFGHLLGHINESANTVINQLIDAGTLSNLQAGFLGKGLRLKLGETRFQPGEWKVVNASGQNLKEQIVPLPVQPPSEVLFKLLGLLLESGRELASVAEIFTGKMPGQNTPATTTQATIEQGMKVFTAIYKRVFRSLTKEFKKVFRLNSLYDENFEKAQLILDEPITKQDYDPKTYDVCPTADPTAVSTTQKALKAQLLMQVIPLGLNMAEVKKRILEAQEQPNIAALLADEQGQPIQPPPDPKVAQMQAKAQTDQAKAQTDQKAQQAKVMMEQEKNQNEMMIKKFEAMLEAQARQMDMKFDQMEAAIKLRTAEAESNMKMRHSSMQHAQKMKHTEEMANAKREATKVSRVEKPKRSNA